jgi:hypothetical protein
VSSRTPNASAIRPLSNHSALAKPPARDPLRPALAIVIELVAHVETESKIARVVQDSRDDAAVGDRAWMPGLNAFCRARQIDIMLGRSLTRKDVGPRASVGKGAELGVDRNLIVNVAMAGSFTQSWQASEKPDQAHRTRSLTFKQQRHTRNI